MLEIFLFFNQSNLYILRFIQFFIILFHRMVWNYGLDLFLKSNIFLL